MSRHAVRRILLLSLHYHLTGDTKLAQRGKEEMLAISAFTDWGGPRTFLDIAEMTAAVAIGYDWLYDQLDATSRKTIAAAITDKALRVAITDSASFARAESNWNPVCLGGLALGALAVAEAEPKLASQILDAAKSFNPYGLKVYAPDGVYFEGGAYWSYGTDYEVLLLQVLESVFGTDGGLSQSPGFLASGAALNHQIGPTGAFFNFSDCGEKPMLDPAMWWISRKLKQPELLGHMQLMLENYSALKLPPSPETASTTDLLLPLVALWWPDRKSTTTAKPLPLNWYGRGPVPLAVFRSAWNDPQAMYLALKGGKASLTHAHMDAGSFVFEANGVRWAHDLGMQDYYSLESKGVDLWNLAQDSQRWTVFRLNNSSHSTLSINAQLHRVDGKASITHFSSAKVPGAIVDLSPVFEGQASKVTRGFAFRSGSHVLVRDEVDGLRAGDTVRWAMLTKAEIALSDATAKGSKTTSEAVLSQDGQKLRVQLVSSVAAKFEIVSAETPKNSFDAPNPGARLLVANLTAPSSGRLNLSVTLQAISQSGPPKPVDDKLAKTNLSRWPIKPAR